MGAAKIASVEIYTYNFGHISWEAWFIPSHGKPESVCSDKWLEIKKFITDKAGAEIVKPSAKDFKRVDRYRKNAFAAVISDDSGKFIRYFR